AGRAVRRPRSAGRSGEDDLPVPEVDGAVARAAERQHAGAAGRGQFVETGRQHTVVIVGGLSGPYRGGQLAGQGKLGQLAHEAKFVQKERISRRAMARLVRARSRTTRSRMRASG